MTHRNETARNYLVTCALWPWTDITFVMLQTFCSITKYEGTDMPTSCSATEMMEASISCVAIAL